MTWLTAAFATLYATCMGSVPSEPPEDVLTIAPPPLLAQMRQHRTDGSDVTEQIDVQGAVPHLERGVQDATFSVATGSTEQLVEAGLVYAMLPLAAYRREIDQGRLRFAPICEPALSQRIGVAATSQLDLPREVMVKVGTTIRDEVAALVKSGRWPAEFVATGSWNPALSE